MRIRRVLAIAWRDLRLVHAGRGWWRLPALALGLLLPAGGLPLRLSPPPVERAAVVAGEVPEQLRGQVQVSPDARVTLSGQDPVTVRAASVSPALRQALDALPGPQVRLVETAPTRRLPGRSLIVALLAISMLTGPLSESLPGERSARTMEVLLSASVRRSELTLGKWLCWTLYGGGLGLLAALGGILSGAQRAGLWPLGLPLVVGCSAALGLWLVRGASDEVAGAGVPMRVLPAAALGLGGLAWLISGAHPALAALMPLGGALLVASDVLTAPSALGLALLGSLPWVGLLLLGVARSLDLGALARPERARGLGPALLAAPLCWLPVAGPGLWAVAGNPNMDLPAGAGVAAAGALMLCLGAVLLARSPGQTLRLGGARELGLGAATGLGLGLGLRALDPLGPVVPSPDWASPLAARLLQSPAEAGPGPLLLWVLGAGLLFRGALPLRAGWALSTLSCVLALWPLSPVHGLMVAGALAAVGRRWGLGAALLAEGLALGIRG